MKVAVVTPWFPTCFGGRFSYILDQILALKRAGMSCRVVLTLPWAPRSLAAILPPRFSAPDEEIRRVLDLCVLRYPAVPRAVAGGLRARAARAALAERLCRRLTTYSPDLVHCHTEDTAYVVAAVGSRTGVPWVLTLHGFDPTNPLTATAWGRSQMASVLQACACVMLVGTPLMRQFQALFPDVRTFTVVGNGFTVPRAVAPSARYARRRRFRISTACNLQPNKGTDLTLRALGELRASGMDAFDMVVVGSGPQQGELVRLVRVLGLSELVHFAGELPHPEALAEIAASDVFCLPSWREACGIAHLEAMALGKVTIACQGQGPADFIANGRTGLLVKPHSVHDVADALACVVAQWPTAVHMGAAGREHVWNSCTWDANAERVRGVYERAVSGRPAAEPVHRRA